MVLKIYQSFRALPLWVQIWVFLILAPVNMFSLYFINEPMGIWIALLANLPLFLNMPVMIADKGFGKMMALPHLIPWTILVVWLITNRPEATGLFDTYLTVLLITNVISLVFDYPDAVKWFKGDRKPAGA